MKETAHKLKSLTAFDISGDYLIGQFERLASDDEETAIDAYTNIARYLLTNDITLADYLRELLTYADSKLIESYIRKEDTNKQYAVEYDVSVIKELAKMSAHKLKDYLFQKFNENFIFSSCTSLQPVLICPYNDSGIRIIFTYFFQRNSTLSGQYLHNPRCTETSLASSHACPDSSLYSIQRPRSKRSSDCIQNLSLSHGFTATDDLSIRWIFLNQFLLFFQT